MVACDLLTWQPGVNREGEKTRTELLLLDVPAVAADELKAARALLARRDTAVRGAAKERVRTRIRTPWAARDYGRRTGCHRAPRPAPRSSTIPSARSCRRTRPR